MNSTELKVLERTRQVSRAEPGKKDEFLLAKCLPCQVPDAKGNLI